MRVLRALLQLILVVAGELGAVLLLHRLGALPFLQVGWRDPAGWLTVAAPEDALLAICRLVALGCAYWLLIGTVLYTGASALRVPAAIRAVQWAALPPVRRVADRAVAVVLTTSSVVGAGGSAWADAPVPPAPPPVVDVVPAGDLYRPVPAGMPGTRSVSGLYFSQRRPPSAPVVEAMPTPVLPSPPPAITHVVEAGDNLWSIAAQHLAAEAGVPARTLESEQVADYWHRVIEANWAVLRSGDPDLLLPGEVIVLPPS